MAGESKRQAKRREAVLLFEEVIGRGAVWVGLAALALFVVASKFSLRHMEDFEMNWLAWFALEAAGICFALAVIIWLIANRFR